MIPFNVNTQSVRQRFWDGQDQIYKDDVTVIKGNHLIQFGGSYQRNFDYHTRSDNGGGINNAIVYQSTSAGNQLHGHSPYIPTTVPSDQYTTYEALYSEALGFVSQPQVAYTRSGGESGNSAGGKLGFRQERHPDLQRIRQRYLAREADLYADLRPRLHHRNAALRNQRQAGRGGRSKRTADHRLRITSRRKQAQALQGQAYNPLIGFAGVRTIGTGLKYPYNPVYNEFSPRVAVAWNPNYDSGILGKLLGHGKTVVRGGYGRIYGRLNGVDLVLVPLLGVGLIQAGDLPGPQQHRTVPGRRQCESRRMCSASEQTEIRRRSLPLRRLFRSRFTRA